jgi:hypothetical protein
MKGRTRRHFLRTVGLTVAGVVGFGAVRGLEVHPSAVVQVQSVAAFSGPFLVPCLKAGQPLAVFWNRGKACLALREHLLGWLPETAAQAWRRATTQGRRPVVQIERTERNVEGRLLLFVKIMSETG